MRAKNEKQNLPQSAKLCAVFLRSDTLWVHITIHSGYSNPDQAARLHNTIIIIVMRLIEKLSKIIIN